MADTNCSVLNLTLCLKRSLYYTSRMFASQIGKGEGYSALGRAVALNFVEFNMFDDNRWIHTGRMQDTRTGEEMSDALELNFVEFRKLGHMPKIGDDKGLAWAMFLTANSGEELEMLSNSETKIETAIDRLQRISLNDEYRYEFEMREKAVRDLESQIEYGVEKGRAEGDRNSRYAITKKMKQGGLNLVDISLYTGISAKDIEDL